MDIRYSTNPRDFKHYMTNEIRAEFLIQDLFPVNRISATYSHIDRMLVLTCKPTTEKVSLDKGIDVWRNFGTSYILERRELGIFNIGNTGKVIVDDEEFILKNRDCIYVSMGTKQVKFQSIDAENPAKFYMVSAPAHKVCKTTYLSINDAKKLPAGEQKYGNQRMIHQFIHPDVLETCQLSMGLTTLVEGSVWNTMPAHTHERRMEIYFYFDFASDDMIFHFMGTPKETRHIVMHSEEAVIGPSWSIHAGCGTSAYSFIWAMGGENKTYSDMDIVNKQDML